MGVHTTVIALISGAFERRTLDSPAFRGHRKGVVYSNLTTASSGSIDNAGTVRLVRASLLVLFTYVFLANAWLGDDAHITFRAVWNLVHGYGFTYNPDERAQARKGLTD